VKRGANMIKITDVTGHRSLEMLKTYSRDAKAFVGHAGRRTALNIGYGHLSFGGVGTASCGSDAPVLSSRDAAAAAVPSATISDRRGNFPG
jgi:hypothetical protein